MARNSLQNPTGTRAARPGSHDGCDCSASFKTRVPSSSGRLPSPGKPGRGNKCPHLCEILAGPVRQIGPGLRIHTGRTYHGDRFGDIIGTEAAGENDRDVDIVDDPPTDAPIVNQAEGAELLRLRVVTVEQQKI